MKKRILASCLLASMTLSFANSATNTMPQETCDLLKLAMFNDLKGKVSIVDRQTLEYPIGQVFEDLVGKYGGEELDKLKTEVYEPGLTQLSEIRKRAGVKHIKDASEEYQEEYNSLYKELKIKSIEAYNRIIDTSLGKLSCENEARNIYGQALGNGELYFFCSAPMKEGFSDYSNRVKIGFKVKQGPNLKIDRSQTNIGAIRVFSSEACAVNSYDHCKPVKKVKIEYMDQISDLVKREGEGLIPPRDHDNLSMFLNRELRVKTSNPTLDHILKNFLRQYTDRISEVKITYDNADSTEETFMKDDKGYRITTLRTNSYLRMNFDDDDKRHVGMDDLLNLISFFSLPRECRNTDTSAEAAELSRFMHKHVVSSNGEKIKKAKATTNE